MLGGGANDQFNLVGDIDEFFYLSESIPNWYSRQTFYIGTRIIDWSRTFVRDDYVLPVPRPHRLPASVVLRSNTNIPVTADGLTAEWLQAPPTHIRATNVDTEALAYLQDGVTTGTTMVNLPHTVDVINPGYYLGDVPRAGLVLNRSVLRITYTSKSVSILVLLFII